MDQDTLNFNQNQLKRAGFTDAFTSSLEQQMNDRPADIRHPFKKEYDGDVVNAVLHLRKSATSDRYFLNKFDLDLQKQGQTDTLKQTFYLTTKRNTDAPESSEKQQKLENRYTLKSAYNALAGRPIHIMLASKEGEQYEAWLKINFKNKLANGNYETKQFTKNYGFELENVLAKYPIKELLNDQYKRSLIDSLERGNLQKATFIGKDGKEESLYISPNITLGALNVYDMNKQRLTTEALIEKNYIGKDLADDIKQRISQKQNIKENSLKQTPAQITQSQTLSPDADEKKQNLKQVQKNDKPAQKQRRKQKIK